jgi:hypothetical protein
MDENIYKTMFEQFGYTITESELANLGLTNDVNDILNLNDMSEAKKKRTERRMKLKRVFNYDAEMKFIKSFWDLKKKEMTIDEFEKLARKTLVEQDQLSDAILDFFIEDEKIRIKIEGLKEKRLLLEDELSNTKKEIKNLEDVLKEDEKDSKKSSSSSSYEDPCSHGSVTRSNC